MFDFRCPLHAVATATCVIANLRCWSKTKSLSLAEEVEWITTFSRTHTCTKTHAEKHLEQDEGSCGAGRNSRQKKSHRKAPLHHCIFLLLAGRALCLFLALFIKWVIAGRAFSLLLQVLVKIGRQTRHWFGVLRLKLLLWISLLWDTEGWETWQITRFVKAVAIKI